MRHANRGSRPFWQRPEGWFTRPEPWLGAAVVLTMLLVEVWQTSHMAQLCLTLEQTRSALVQANAGLTYSRAAADRRSTRAELTPLADQLGLKATRREQIWKLPSEYLADDRTPSRADASGSLLALAERVSGALV